MTADWFLVYITAALAVATYSLYRATVNLGRDAKQSGATQLKRMDESVREAARAATAMEGVATAMVTNTTLMRSMIQKQMRAYVAVEFGAATFQDAYLRFQAHPVLNNTGLTPARNVSFKIMSAFHDVRNEAEIELPDTQRITTSDVSLAPRQPLTIHGPALDKVHDGDVAEIKGGGGRRLFVWGAVTYEDIYGDKWQTNFCINYFWVGETLYSFYFPRHNSAT